MHLDLLSIPQSGGKNVKTFCLKKNLSASRPSELLFKENLNASGPSEHLPVRGENVKTFRWDHRPKRLGETASTKSLYVIQTGSPMVVIAYWLPTRKKILEKVKVCMYVWTITYSMDKDQLGKVANPARGQLNRENYYFPVPVRA